MNFSKCWLDYKPLTEYEQEWLTLAVQCEGKIVSSAVREYKLAMKEMTGKELDVINTPAEQGVNLKLDAELVSGQDGYTISVSGEKYEITGQSESGILYGVFHFLRLIRTGHLEELPVANTPEMPLRIMNHWDNMDGSIERGYSGESFFYKDYEILWDERIEQYTRMMASIGINAIVINNVNVHEKETYLITDRYLQQVKQYSDLFNQYGISLYTSVNFAAPM